MTPGGSPPQLQPRRLRVRVKRVGGVPTVAVRLWLCGGSRLEDIPGQAWIAGRLLSEGSRRRDWQQLAREADDRSMVISSFGVLEAQGLSIDALASDPSPIVRREVAIASPKFTVEIMVTAAV